MKLNRAVGAVALGALASFCIAAHAQTTVKIGAVQGLSGPPAIVDFGESYLQGNQMALKEYNAASPKHKIEFIVYNDEANPQRAVSLVQRLISNDRVSAIIGTVNSGNVAAFAPMVQQAPPSPPTSPPSSSTRTRASSSAARWSRSTRSRRCSTGARRTSRRSACCTARAATACSPPARSRRA
jgi:branched-chain amino acid transport system substrate-binding protein